MDQRELRDITGTFATGVTVITTKNEENYPVGMTANSFSALSLSPSLVLINLDKKVSLYKHFMEAENFAVNILNADQEYLSRQFSRKNIDRFEGIDYEDDITGAPILKYVLGYLDCTVVNRYDGGDHTIIIGETKGGKAKEGSPLLFFKGKYANLNSDLIKQ